MPAGSKDDIQQRWAEAEKALEEARRLPGGKERIEALKEAGRLRYQADKLRQTIEKEAP